MKKSVVKQPPIETKTVVPDIKVELEPVFEVTTPAPDMEVIANAIKEISTPIPNIDVHVPKHEKVARTIKAEVTERDNRGGIKTLILTEL